MVGNLRDPLSFTIIESLPLFAGGKTWDPEHTSDISKVDHHFQFIRLTFCMIIYSASTGLDASEVQAYTFRTGINGWKPTSTA